MIVCILGITLVAAIVTSQVGMSASANVCSNFVYPGDEGADIKIVAVLGIHESDKDRCSSNYNTRALQNAIAINWAAHLLNGNNQTNSFIPGVRIGIDVYDDCNTKYLAASHAGTLASYMNGITMCSADSDTLSQEIPIAGVIGTSISLTTTVVTKILEPVNVPVVGPSATLDELSDKIKYPNFISVVPSDVRQAKVIINLAKHFSWSYIVGVSTSDNYGTMGIAELMKIAKEEMICVTLIPDFDLFNGSEMTKFVRTTLANTIEHTKHYLGIVYFGLNPPLIRFLKYVEINRSLWSKADNELLKKLYWVASDAVEASQDLAKMISQYNTNILIVSPFLVKVRTFEEYFKDFIMHPPLWINGPWRSVISSVVKNNLRCNNYNFTEESMAGCNINDNLVINSYIPSVLDAFYLLANTLKAIHSIACNDTSGPCSAFKSNLTNGLLKRYKVLDLNYSSINTTYIPEEFSKSQRKLKNISGDFEVINQPLYSLLAISKTTISFIKAAELKDERITMLPEFSSQIFSSECKAMCEECLYLTQMSSLFYPGDVIFLGIFSITWKSDKEPYKCLKYREKSMSYVAMEAFINAIYHLRNITGINFGYLILDDCYSALTLTRMLNGVLSGDIKIQNIGDDRIFNASKVAVAIGAQSSPVTMAALPILTELRIPMISYSATHPILNNRMLFPYFSRTVSSDDIQAKVLVDIVKQLNVTYVGAIVIQNSYGIELYNLFKSFAESKSICVDDANTVTEMTPREKYATILQAYKSKSIKVIVIIAMDKIITTFLTAVKLEDVFVFIGSEAWGPNMDIIGDDNGKKARGALVLGTNSVQLNTGLMDHLQTLDAFGNKSSVWLLEFWQDKFQCDLPGGFSNSHTKICDSSPLSSLTADNMAHFPLSAHATLATMSAGYLVSSFLNNKKQMPFNPEEFTKDLHKIQLHSSTQTVIKPFLDSGNGNSTFDIYNVQQSADNEARYVYIQVGSYKNNSLTLNKSLIKFYDVAGHSTDKIESSCITAGSQCKALCAGTQVTTTFRETSTSGTTNLQGGERSETASVKTAAIILAVFLGLSVLIIIILIVLGFLIFTGRVKIRGRSLLLNINNKRSPSTLSPRVREASYSSPNDSSSSDFPPQLPIRITADSNIVYSNKAFSDIIPPNYLVAAESASIRDRANSLPEFSHNSIVQTHVKQPTTSKILHIPQHLPTGYKVLQSVLNESQTVDEVEQQLRLSQNGLPVMSSSDTGTHGQDTPYLFYQKPGDNNSYRNTQNSMNLSPKYLYEPIIFQNGPEDGAIYTHASSFDNNQHAFSITNLPESAYVPVQTQAGIIFYPLRDFNIMQNTNNLYLHNDPNPGFIPDGSEQRTVQGITDPAILGGSLSNGSGRTISGLPTEYITPIDVPYMLSPDNPSVSRLSPESGSKKYLIYDKTGAVVSQTGVYYSDDACKFPLKSHIVGTHSIDTSNYVQPYHYVHKTPIRQTEMTFNSQSKFPNPSELDIVPTFSNNQSLMSIRQKQGPELKRNVRPDNLPLTQVYFPRNQNAPILFSHVQPEGLQKGHLHLDITPTEIIQNKSVIKEALIDEGTLSMTPPEEHLRKQRGHHSQVRAVLSLLEEESEEMV